MKNEGSEIGLGKWALGLLALAALVVGVLVYDIVKEDEDIIDLNGLACNVASEAKQRFVKSIDLKFYNMKDKLLDNEVFLQVDDKVYKIVLTKNIRGCFNNLLKGK